VSQESVDRILSLSWSVVTKKMEEDEATGQKAAAAFFESSEQNHALLVRKVNRVTG